MGSKILFLCYECRKTRETAEGYCCPQAPYVAISAEDVTRDASGRVIDAYEAPTRVEGRKK